MAKSPWSRSDNNASLQGAIRELGIARQKSEEQQVATYTIELLGAGVTNNERAFDLNNEGVVVGLSGPRNRAPLSGTETRASFPHPPR
jgi:hypothetical protein